MYGRTQYQYVVDSIKMMLDRMVKSPASSVRTKCLYRTTVVIGKISANY